MLVESHHIVKVAADIAGRAEERVEVDAIHLREDLGKEVLLNPGGEAKLLVETVHQKTQRLVAPAEHIELGVQALDLILQAAELIENRYGTGQRKGERFCVRLL